MKKRIAVIGSGFSGLSAAAYAARAGNEVMVFEKNSIAGGRARQFKTDNGYTFDMGPSWYWMPDIIENFFLDFTYEVKEFYKLIKLDPQFEMIFSEDKMTIPASYESLKELFEKTEKGSGIKLDAFMKAAKYKYDVGMLEYVNKPCKSWTEFISPRIAASAFRMDLLTNFRSYVSKYFKNEKLRALMEFPVIFLGASPEKIPALYSMMNYGGYVLGTLYPQGGFYELVKAMQDIGENQGATFHFNKNVEKIITDKNKVTGLKVNGEIIEFDAVIASSDYHHTETLIDEQERNYNEAYWKSRTFAPSCLIYYLGFNKRIPKLQHHTLFFENDLDKHIHNIYEDKKWPEAPLFYACCPSKTDDSVAPKGHENVFLLMPLATGIEDNESIREKYFMEMIKRLEKHTQTTNLIDAIDYKKSYCITDFINDYNAYEGNAYGLANTLKQTAVLKPSIKNKKIKNLFYCGQLTVPGPGVPPSIISGKIVANQITKSLNR